LSQKAHILIVDDDRDVLEATRIFLKQHGFQVDTEERPVFVTQLLKNRKYDLVLLDMNFSREGRSGNEGFYWLSQILETDPSIAIILITAYGDMEQAIKAIQKGATDFITKPWESEKLLATIHKVLKINSKGKQARGKVDGTENQAEEREIIGRSEAIQKVFQTIDKVAGTDANVLILGENGTGKELVARALHRKSKRSQEVFVNVDMGAISETLFESELFGHVKGAFTDARDNRIGRFEAADQGTLFLDEIGNLSLPLQAKLLSAIQQRKIVRVGSNQPIAVDIRLVCATNLPLKKKVAQREFRQDLLYRINTVEIHLPPLRERKEDISLLADHFVQVYSQQYDKLITGISTAALARMEKYPWPGNIRELQHAVERAIIMTDSEILQPSDFNLVSVSDLGSGLQLDTYNLEEVEKLIIRKAITKHSGNISRAAKELGLTRTSLYRRIEKYGLL
jgi:DNA-binding NtrC family response regulator